MTKVPIRDPTAVFTNQGEGVAQMKVRARLEGDVECLSIEFVGDTGEKIGLEAARDRPCQQSRTFA